MKIDQVTEESIRLLVDTFYKQVRVHDDLGPVFNNAIGGDDVAWGPHLSKMYHFWSSVMLTSGRYHGTPMQKHQDLPRFDEGLFDQWLVLFEETARSIHSDDIADQYAEKSQRIANSLKLSLYYKLEKAAP